MAAENVFCQQILNNWAQPFQFPSKLPFTYGSMNNYLSMQDLASLVMHNSGHGDMKYLMQPSLVRQDILFTQQQQNQLGSLVCSYASGSAQRRDPSLGPLRKLSIDLIKTYKKINEVCLEIYDIKIMSLISPGWLVQFVGIL